MEKTPKLTKERIEYIKTYLLVFAKAFSFVTGKKLETLEQLVSAIEKDEITFDDVFEEFLERCFKTNMGEDKEEYFWEDNMELFGRQNYFPDNSKQIGEGAWIKIRNENGFEIHYAKKANRKRRYNEEYEAICKKIVRLYKKDISDLQDMNTNIDEVLTPAKEKKKKELENKKLELGVRIILNSLPVYEVKVMRTKSVAEYYLPSQYEIINDIDEYANAYIAKVPSLKIKTLYTSQNKDAVFYLQSRGITKEVAEMMAALKQTYFTFNMKEGIETYNTFLRENVEIVEAN